MSLKETPPLNVRKKNAQTNVHVNHLLSAWVKLLGVIQFLHTLEMARNQHCRHGTTEIFHASVLLQTQYHSRKWKHKKRFLFYVQLVNHDLQDGCSALIYYLLESKKLTMLSTNTSCFKKQGKVAVFQAGLVIETIDCY